MGQGAEAEGPRRAFPVLRSYDSEWEALQVENRWLGDKVGRKCEIYKIKYENLGGVLEEMQLRREIVSCWSACCR